MTEAILRVGVARPFFSGEGVSGLLLVLQESKVGLAVGKLRAHKTKPISDLSKEIVRQWKAAVEKGKATQTGVFSFFYLPSSHFANARVAFKKPSIVTPTVPVSDVRTFKSDGVKGGTGDITRDKCIELIYDGLASDATARTSLFPISWLDLSFLQPLITYSPKLGAWNPRYIKTWVGLIRITRTRFVPCS